MVLSLAACGSKGDSKDEGGDSKDGVTLEFQQWWGVELPDGALDDICKDFTKDTGINIKLMKCTGMREAWKMVTLARALDMKVMVGCMTETSCAITAASQFSPAVDFADLDGSLLIANDRFKGMEVVKGKITLPDLPGIGVVKL